jgi:hypothetical protein
MRVSSSLLFAGLLVGLLACSSLKNASNATPDATGGDGGTTSDEDGSAAGRDDGGQPSADGGATGNGDPRWPQSRVPADSPAPASYTITNGTDGAVLTDSVTGLVWQDSVPTTLRSFDEATAYCSGLVYNGLDDWRLPTRVEAIGIMSFGGFNETKLTSTAFSALDVPCVWTASEALSTGDHAWSIGVANIAPTTKTNDCAARCVRGAPIGTPIAKVFTIQATTVTDPVTHLLWERTPIEDELEFDAAEARCAGLTIDGATWRLPTVKELVSIVDETRQSPALAPAFGDWSVRSWSANDRWLVDFDRGDTFQAASGFAYNARCVSSLP